MTEDAFDSLVAKNPVTTTDEKIQSLESEIQTLKTKMNEDRFITVGLFVVLFDGYLFEHMNNWGGPIGLLILEFFILLVLGRKFGIEDITRFSDKVINAIGSRNRTS